MWSRSARSERGTARRREAGAGAKYAAVGVTENHAHKKKHLQRAASLAGERFGCDRVAKSW